MDKKTLPHFAAVLLLFWVAGACGAQEGGAKDFLSKIVGPSRVSSLQLQNDWMGLSEFGPVKKAYLLKPDAQGFAGKAVFSLGGGSNILSKEFPLSIPRDAIEAFFSQLSRSVLEKGEYKPKIDHTDDYPTLGITVEMKNSRMEFFSQSQGDLAVPWGARFGSETFVVNTKNPGEAFRVLDPYLKPEMMRSLEEEWRAKRGHR